MASANHWYLQPTAAPAGPWRWWLPGVPAALAWLRDHGVGRGQRLALSGAASPGLLAMLQAAPLAGVTAVLVNRRLHSDEFAAQHRRAAADALAVGGEVPGANGLATLTLPEDFAGPAVTTPTPFGLLAPLADGDPALVIFSSGTTGAAKAVRLGWGAIRSAATAAVAHLGLDASDHWLACLPPDHIGGASIAYRAGVSGYRLTLVERFDAELVNRLIDDLPITGISLVPTMLHRLLALRHRPWPKTLRCLLTGGGPLSAELIARSTALGLAPCQTYGLSEAASQVCTLRPSEAAAHPGTAGGPLPGMSLRIARADGGDAAADEVGEIAVRGPHLFSGYERDGALAEPHPAGAWFATGDLGSRDSGGRLTVRCRRDDLVVSGGENIYPAEVEAALERHPAIAAAAVCGLADAEWGQVVVAALVARDQPLADEALRDWLRLHLTGFKQPRRWRWLEALPRTANGKLQRGNLPALFSG